MTPSYLFQSDGVAGFFKALARPAVGLVRAAPVHAASVLQRGRGPLAVFLPAYGPKGAALLRMYNVAAALRLHGWRTLVLPSTLTLAQRHRFLGRLKADVLVMQGVRHALNRPWLYPDHKVVFDMDDADFHLPHLAKAVRQAMPGVATVIAGSSYVADWCRAAGAPGADVVWTGNQITKRARQAQIARPPVIAWAQSRPMNYTREADVVRKVTAAIAARHPGATLRLFDFEPGDDPGFARTFHAAGLNVEWRRSCRYRDYLASFDDVALGFAPLCPETPFSRGKSFGKVLAYLDAHVPVIASDAGEHAAFFTQRTGVISNDPDVWVDEACRLLKDAAAREVCAQSAFEDYCARLSLAAVSVRVARILNTVIA